MGQRSKISIEGIIRLYTVDHLTCEQIGLLAGVGRQAIAKRLRQAGVDSKQGTWVDCVCLFCSKEYKVTRSSFRVFGSKYCSTTCYGAAITSPQSHIWRHGQRLARLIVAQHFSLQAGHVVHHVDGDDRNNDRINLAVYASQADHIKAHRGGKVKPLWTGV